MKNTVIIDTAEKKSKISKDIYGHFSEHLGRCIYGGFWVGKNSDIPNINGYRKDVVQAFKEIGIANLRWPGGCFADEYHWKDGIGPQEGRKRMINTHWGGVVEDNSFGTNEFLGLCEELGCKPYINGNVGSGSVQEMDEWVEYMTFSGESPMSRLREKYGRKEPWTVDFFGVGNESWGCGGNMRPEYYADLYRRYQTYVRQYGNNKIFKIACGPNSSDYNWTEVLMQQAKWCMDGLSLHNYTVPGTWEDKGFALNFTDEQYYKTINATLFMETLVRRHDEIMTKYDPEKKVALVVDEWGTWYNVEPGTNPGFLYQQNTVRDAIVAGINLNIFNNHSDRVRIANIAQAVNVLQSPVLTEGDKIVLTPTWHVFKMYKKHHNATLLGSTVASESAGLYDKKIVVPGLHVSASETTNEKTGKTEYFVTVVNTDIEKSKTLDLGLANLKGKIAKASAEVISGASATDYNSFEKPDTVGAKALSVKITDAQTITAELPPHSVTGFTISL